MISTAPSDRGHVPAGFRRHVVTISSRISLRQNGQLLVRKQLEVGRRRRSYREYDCPWMHPVNSWATPSPAAIRVRACASAPAASSDGLAADRVRPASVDALAVRASMFSSSRSLARRPEAYGLLVQGERIVERHARRRSRRRRSRRGGPSPPRSYAYDSSAIGGGSFRRLALLLRRPALLSREGLSFGFRDFVLPHRQRLFVASGIRIAAASASWPSSPSSILAIRPRMPLTKRWRLVFPAEVLRQLNRLVDR